MMHSQDYSATEVVTSDHWAQGTKERVSDIPMSTRSLGTAIGIAIDCSMHPTRSGETRKLKDEGVEERAIRLRKLTSAENDCGEIPTTRFYH
jgi:hypothetical protein